MSNEVIYYLKTPILDKNFDENTLTFTINKIRSRRPSVIYFKLHCYNMEDTEIYYDESIKTDGLDVAYTSPRAVIGNPTDKDGNILYDHYHQTFTINQNLVDVTSKYRIEMIVMGVDSENPLYFTELMFQEGEFSEYHLPSEEIVRERINIPNGSYVNLYNHNDYYLQVIRPNRESFYTNELTGAELTILAPHFEEEDEDDNPINIFLEALNQTEQTINVLK